MTSGIQIVKVDEVSAQMLADLTGKVVYLADHRPQRSMANCCAMTTDREEAVSWGEFVAFAPALQQQCAYCDYRGATWQLWEHQHTQHVEEYRKNFQQVNAPMIYPAHKVEATAGQADAWALGGNLGELARRTLGEQQVGDQYFAAHPSGLDKGLIHFDPENLDEPERPNYSTRVAGHTFNVPKDVTNVTGDGWWVAKDGTERPIAADDLSEPEEQLRVVRVLELRGPRSWVEKTLANSLVNPIKPFVTSQAQPGEIVEQIRTQERLCRWCGGEHLGACSEEECSGNPRKGRY